MNANEELLQRCFDNDLNDAEMKQLFSALASSGTLRKKFMSFQSLRMDLHSLSGPAAPLSLDGRIGALEAPDRHSVTTGRPMLFRILSERYTVSPLMMAAAVLAVMLGSFFAARISEPEALTTEYIYVSQLPPYIVQSSYQGITNN